VVAPESVAALTVAPPILAETIECLARCGDGRHECVVYWCAAWQDPRRVHRVVHPRHTARAFGYEVDSAWVTAFFLDLRAREQTVVAQVHTHPREASHSQVDDTYALAPATGILSLVIPDFALAGDGLDRAHLMVMRADGSWAPIDVKTALGT